MSQTAKLTPNLDKHGTKILNLTVLQRIDPFIEEILLTAAHVAFYEFNIDNTQWSRKDVEGSLFVVKRNAQPRFQFIVMNRRNTENLVENLLGDFEYEVQVPYLLYRNAAQEVNGIWFYNPRECEEVANLFSRILNAYSKVPPKVKESSSKSEFEELGVFSRRSIMEEPPEPPSTAPAATNVPENSSFENFFNAALNVGNGISNKANSRQPVVPLSSHTAVAVSAPMPSQQASSIPLSSFPSSVAVHDTREPIDSANRITNLVKPSTFFTPPSSSALLMPSVSSTMPTTTTIHPPQNLQRPYGTPLLQPFPPPAPPPSFTPSSTSQFLISRDKIRDALLMLVQDDQFVDMFHQAVVKSQLS